MEARIGEDMIVILELLADIPEVAGGRVAPLPTEGRISAMNIPHASMVFDRHLTREITAALLADGGMATETVRFADLVSFTCLKALALDDRGERKDAHDLVYCIEHWRGARRLPRRFSTKRARASMPSSSTACSKSCAHASPMTKRPKAIARTVRWQSHSSSAAVSQKQIVRHGCCGRGT